MGLKRNTYSIFFFKGTCLFFKFYVGVKFKKKKLQNGNFDVHAEYICNTVEHQINSK